MHEDDKSGHGHLRATGRYILIGLVTAAPLAITWWIVHFLFAQLSALGRPWIFGLSVGIRPRYPDIADVLVNETLQSIAAVLVVLLFLYVLGWGAGRVIGQRLIALFESAIGAIPFVDSIYRATKRFLAVAATTPEGQRRVVLIDFPSPDMKAIGLVTRTMRDSETGEELAAVYVPTSPNPTSGYIEIVPMKAVVFTDWTFDQAMSFVVTGGANAPDHIRYRQPAQDKVTKRIEPAGKRGSNS
jgi:uncharacterized membrane protein